jgi:acyl-lipid omega-6 desaturase (Delta-12 desaturase)
LRMQATGMSSLVQIRRTLPIHKRSTWRGLVIFICCLSLYVLAVVSLLWIPSAWLLSSVGIAIATVQLLIIGHEAAHQTLTTNKALNLVLGRLAFLPSFHSFTVWDLSHNRLHHQYPNLRSKDIGWGPLTIAEYETLCYRQQYLERFYRSGWGFGLYYVQKIWFPSLRLPAPTTKDSWKLFMDNLLVSIYALSYFVLLITFSEQWWLGVLGGFVIPFFLWTWLLGFASYTQHTHETIVWYADIKQWDAVQATLGSSPHIVFPTLVRHLFFNIMEHTAHHIDASIPYHSLSECQNHLEQQYPEQVILQQWTWKNFVTTLAKCKLYDYEHHQWLDHKGKPTSRTLLPSGTIPENFAPADTSHLDPYSE